MRKFKPISLGGGGYPANPASLMSEESGLHLYIDNPGVATLPEEGKITFTFKRGPLTLKEGAEDEGASAAVDLTLMEICCVEECEVEDFEPSSKQTENALDDIFNSLRGEEEPENEEGEEEDES